MNWKSITTRRRWNLNIITKTKHCAREIFLGRFSLPAEIWHIGYIKINQKGSKKNEKKN